MQKILRIFIWMLTGSLVAVLDCVAEGTGMPLFAAPQLLIAFWMPLMVMNDDPMLILKALPGFLIIDFYAATPFGFYSLSLLGGIYITCLLFQKVFSSVSLVTIVAGSIFCSIVSRAILYMFLGLILLLHKGQFPVNFSVITTSLQEAIATSVVSGVFFLIYRRLFKRVRRSAGNFITL